MLNASTTFPSLDGISDRTLTECLAYAENELQSNNRPENNRIVTFAHAVYKRAVAAERETRYLAIFHQIPFEKKLRAITLDKFISKLSEQAQSNI